MPEEAVLFIDGEATVCQYMQLRPDNWDEVVAWADGVKTIIDGNQAVTLIRNEQVIGVVHLGDTAVLPDEGELRPMSAEEFNQALRG